MLSSLLAPFRFAAKVLLVVLCVPVGLVVVLAGETVRGIAEEWALAFWRVRAFVRPARALS